MKISGMVLAVIAAIAIAFFGYVQWTGASVGLAGSGRMLVVEHVDSEDRMRRIEEDRMRVATDAHPTRRELETEIGSMARPATVAEEPSGENYWIDYRGPERAGIYDQTPINTDWPPDGPPELWRQEVGGGYASMVVADSLVFTIEQRRDREVVAAYGLMDGAQIWEHSWKSRFSESMGETVRAQPLLGMTENCMP